MHALSFQNRPSIKNQQWSALLDSVCLSKFLSIGFHIYAVSIEQFVTRRYDGKNQPPTWISSFYKIWQAQ